MTGKKLVCFMAMCLVFLGFSSLCLASDDDNRLEVSVQAPIETINCTNTPATITVLTLPIDVSKAAFSAGRHKGSIACADLAVGETVQVALTSDVEGGWDN